MLSASLDTFVKLIKIDKIRKYFSINFENYATPRSFKINLDPFLIFTIKYSNLFNIAMIYKLM